MSLTTKLLIAAGLAAAAYFGHGAMKSAYVKQGYDAAVAEYQADNNELLRKAQQAWAGQVDQLAKLQGEVDVIRKNLAAAVARERAASEQRLREAQLDFDTRVATASAESVRRYAEATRGDLLGCRADLARFGYEAAGAAAAAHALKKELDLRAVSEPAAGSSR